MIYTFAEIEIYLSRKMSSGGLVKCTTTPKYVAIKGTLLSATYHYPL